MMHVYVCSPYSGDIKANVAYAAKCCRHVLDQGHIPMAPHLELPAYIDEATERDTALRVCAERIRRCDEVWVFSDTVTPGMRADIAAAQAYRTRIRFKELAR